MECYQIAFVNLCYQELGAAHCYLLQHSLTRVRAQKQRWRLSMHTSISACTRVVVLRNLERGIANEKLPRQIEQLLTKLVLLFVGITDYDTDRLDKVRLMHLQQERYCESLQSLEVSKLHRAPQKRYTESKLANSV